jgi:hypothetical protein
MTNKMPVCQCPTCESTLDAALASDGSDLAVVPGDVTMCVYCTEILEFTEEFMLTKVDINTLPIELQDSLVMIKIGIQAQRPTLH